MASYVKVNSCQFQVDLQLSKFDLLGSPPSSRANQPFQLLNTAKMERQVSFLNNRTEISGNVGDVLEPQGLFTTIYREVINRKKSRKLCQKRNVTAWKCYYGNVTMLLQNSELSKTVNCTDAQIGMLLNLISASLCQKRTNCNPTGEDKKSLKADWQAHKSREAESIKMEAEVAIADSISSNISISLPDIKLCSENSCFHYTIHHVWSASCFAQIWAALYNFKIYETATRNGFATLVATLVVWDETEGKRSANEIGSILIDHLKPLPP